MKYFLFTAVLLGSLTICQPAVNRLVLEQRGLAFAALLNAVVLFCLCLIFFAVSYFFGDGFSMFFKIKKGIFKPWFLFPGLMGFFIVILTPLMIQRLGAVKTVIAMLCGQVAVSIFLDAVVFKSPISIFRILGLALTLAGAYLSFIYSV